MAIETINPANRRNYKTFEPMTDEEVKILLIRFTMIFFFGKIKICRIVKN